MMKVLNSLIKIILKNHFSNKKASNYRKLVNDLKKLNKPQFSSKNTILFYRPPSGIIGSLIYECLLAKALELRGYSPIFIICDGFLDGCIKVNIQHNKDINEWDKVCINCIESGTNILSSAGLKFKYLSQYINNDELSHIKKLSEIIKPEQIKEYSVDNIPLGYYALSSTERFYKGADKRDKELYTQILRKYLLSSLIVNYVSKNIIKTHNPIHVVMQHGIYVDWGPMFNQAVLNNVNVTLWMRGYLNNNYFLKSYSSISDTGHIYEVPENYWGKIRTKKLTKTQHSELNKFLENWSDKSFNKNQQNTEAQPNIESLIDTLNINQELPAWGIFTHLNWDAVFAIRNDMIFETSEEWILKTVEEIIIMRVHFGHRHKKLAIIFLK